MNNPIQTYDKYTPAQQSWSETIFDHFEWQEGDVVISSGAKQGSTWMQNIVHQLRTGGDGDFNHIEEVCPRPEGVEYPGQSDRERIESWFNKAFCPYAFRVFKTHASPPTLPFNAQVKYIIPVRNGKDTIISFYHYRNNTTEAFQSLWGGRPHHFPSFEVCFDWYLDSQAYWSLINRWLPYRHEKNVLFLHYSDLKGDMESNLQRIANFLNLEITPAQWSNIVEKCGFEWMRSHSSKFEPKVISLNLPIIDKGGMIRKGKVGDHHHYFTPEQESRWDTLHRKLLPDDAIRHWCDQGGKFPSNK